MRIKYQNWSTDIFDGFYESNLFNSDTELYLTELLQEKDEEYEISNFEAYQEDISQKAAELLEEICESPIIKSIKYLSITSPRYYNYSTDKLNLLIDVNLTKLKKYINKNKTAFDKYLKENFTSYDGFISFVDNNYKDFIHTYKTNKSEKERCINVMLEYYILEKIKDSDYHQELYEYNGEIQLYYAEKIEESKNYA